MAFRPLVIGTVIALFGSIMFAVSGQAVAEETVNYGQQILPINCVYEVVDTGTQTLRYLTPETCPDPPTTEPLDAVPSETTSQNPSQTTPASNFSRPTDQTPDTNSSPSQTTITPAPAPDNPAPNTKLLLDVVTKRYDIILIVVAVIYVIIILAKQHRAPTSRGTMRPNQKPRKKTTKHPKKTKKANNKKRPTKTKKRL